MAIVTPELWGVTRESGGISTFVRHLARLLVARGDRVTLVVGTAKESELDPEWAARYRDDGVEVVRAVASFPEVPVYGYPEGPDFVFRLISEAVERAIPASAEVVYFPDWGGLGLDPLRRARLSRSRARPATVTVVHGIAKWVRETAFEPALDPVADTSIDFAERYTIERADFVAAPSRFYRDWLTAQGVRFGDEGRTSVVGYPWLPLDDRRSAPPPAAPPRFGQLVFFGRQQAGKGFDLFVDALRSLRKRRPELVAELERVVFLGADRDDRSWSRDDVVRALTDWGVEAAFVTDLDTWGARRFLEENRADALVVIPSLLENFPYAVIEASLIPGLNVICSRVGGIPEVLGPAGEARLFEPHPKSLRMALERRLEEGPNAAGGLPEYDWRNANARWLELHEEALELARTRPSPTRRPAAATKQIDVCVPHFDLGRYLPQTLESLAAQTTEAFTVTVVDAGSTDPGSLDVFEEMRARYEPGGWRFLRRERGHPGWARNVAVASGDAPYVSFVDADDVVAPTMLEELLAGIEDAGVDCVTCYAIEFEGDESPFDAPPVRLIKPLGGGTVSAIFYNPYGLPHCLMKRATFEQLGGFGDVGYWGEYKLYLRLALAGGTFDVVPEYLFYYRRRPDSRSRTEVIESVVKSRVLETFSDSLAPLGLQDLPELVRSQHAEILRLRRIEAASVDGFRGSAAGLPWRALVGGLGFKSRTRIRRGIGGRVRRLRGTG